MPPKRKMTPSYNRGRDGKQEKAKKHGEQDEKIQHYRGGKRFEDCPFFFFPEFFKEIQIFKLKDITNI